MVGVIMYIGAMGMATAERYAYWVDDTGCWYGTANCPWIEDSDAANDMEGQRAAFQTHDRNVRGGYLPRRHIPPLRNLL